jgi:RNA polymerase sigma-70 factor (ECF subfamily)
MHDIAIYEILVREHEAMLFAYVLGITGEAELSEEVVQAAFVQAYQKLSTLRDKAAFGAWIRTIARNLAFTELKRRGREVTMDAQVIDGMEDVFGGLDANPDGQTWPERAKVVELCYEALSKKLKETCRMHYFDGMKTQSIADQLSTSLAAVLKRLERARDAIRNCVEQKLSLEEL